MALEKITEEITQDNVSGYLGQVVRVVHPIKGDWNYDYTIVGAKLPDDEAKEKGVKPMFSLETVKRIDEDNENVKPRNKRDKPMGEVPRCPISWVRLVKPDAPEAPAKPTPAPTPTAKPVPAPAPA